MEFYVHEADFDPFWYFFYIIKGNHFISAWQ
jgi:hypothetical protein